MAAVTNLLKSPSKETAHQLYNLSKVSLLASSWLQVLFVFLHHPGAMIEISGGKELLDPTNCILAASKMTTHRAI